MNTCARCGIAEEDLPEIELPNGEVTKKFALFDSERLLYICHGCIEAYNELLPLATQYPMLVDLPELLGDLYNQVPDSEQEFFKKLLPLGKL